MKIALCIDSFYPCIDGPINVTSSLASILIAQTNARCLPRRQKVNTLTILVTT